MKTCNAKPNSVSTEHNGACRSGHRRPVCDSQPLGTITKSHVMPELQGLSQNDYDFVLKRAEKYHLKNLSSTALPETVVRINKKTGEEHRSYVHRVNYCLKRRISKDKAVGVLYNEKRGKAHYGNLQRCGSVWTCPICAAKITEGRREEVKTGFKNWHDKGGYIVMATFTNRHHIGDNLEDLLSGQKKAFKKFWEKTKLTTHLKHLGYKGRLVATEVTHGVNGWHPHYHAIMFFEHEVSPEEIQTLLGLEWQDACKKSGMKIPSLDNGVLVHDAAYADRYVTKWGLEEEITKGHVKKGREGSLTPFDILRQSEDDPYYGKLFRQYADAFKGKRQLVWSKGLKEMLGIVEISDEELAVETEKDSIVLDEIALVIWELIYRHKKEPDLLHAYELDYQDGGSRAYDLKWSLAEIEADKLRDSQKDYEISPYNEL